MVFLQLEDKFLTGVFQPSFSLIEGLFFVGLTSATFDVTLRFLNII